MSGDTTVVSAVWNAGLAAVVGYVQPQGYARKVRLITVVGPADSTLRMFAGYQVINAYARTSIYPADNRTYDSAVSGAITIGPGEAMTFAWTGGSSGAGQTATAVIQSETG